MDEEGANVTNPAWLVEQVWWDTQGKRVSGTGSAQTLPMSEQAMRAQRDKPKNPIGFKPKRRRKK